MHLLACLTIFSNSLRILVENLLRPSPPLQPTPPKTPVIARTIVEIVIEKAVNIENMVMPCSRNRVRIISANDVFLSRTFSRVFLTLATCVRRSFRFCDSISSLAFFRYLSRLICLCMTAFAHQNKSDHFLPLPAIWYLCLCVC